METFEREKTIMAHENPIGTLVAAKQMLFGGSLKVIKVGRFCLQLSARSASLSVVWSVHLQYTVSRKIGTFLKGTCIVIGKVLHGLVPQ